MKSQYLFRHENQPLSVASVIYHVWVGTSEHEKKLFEQVRYEAQHYGYTLRLWSEDVDFWLLLEAERVFSEAGILNFGFQRADVTITELRELCYSHCFESFERTLSVSSAFTRMLRHARPDLYRRKSLSSNTKAFASPIRKNLSQEIVTEQAIENLILS